MEALCVEDVSIRLDTWDVLENISLNVPRGTTVAIIGPSGCGKSTLLRIIAGYCSPDHGHVSFFGQPVSGASAEIALMPQQDMLLPWYTLLDNVSLPLRLRGVKRQQAHQQAMGYLPDFGLSGFERAYPDQLSGGMRQRAALLRTVLSHAQVLLLDEPFGALDAITRRQMQRFLLEKARAYQATQVLVTHDIEEALLLSNRIVVLGGHPARIVYSIDIPDEASDEWLLTPECARIKQPLMQALESFQN